MRQRDRQTGRQTEGRKEIALLYALLTRGGSRKNIGGWPVIMWEATTSKRNYNKTNYIKHVEKLDLNYPEKKFRGPGQDLGGLFPLAPT